MRFRTSMIAAIAACVLVSGAAVAQVPAATGGSGEHGVGAGPDPKAMGGAGMAAPDATAAPAPMDQGDAMAAKPVKHKMTKKHMSKKMHSSKMHKKTMSKSM